MIPQPLHSLLMLVAVACKTLIRSLQFDLLQWGLQAINAADAHAAGVKGEGVVVAVLDAGIVLISLHASLFIIGSFLRCKVVERFQ
jgi:hypothetical protein